MQLHYDWKHPNAMNKKMYCLGLVWKMHQLHSFGRTSLQFHLTNCNTILYEEMPDVDVTFFLLFDAL